jgi:4-amino-4-deoxy-L-arabinose transferase-like glycosyltransferase
MFKLFGFGAYQGRVLQLLMGFLSIFLVYWLGKHYFDRETGYLAASLWALSHVWWITAHQSRPDMMAICAILGTVILFEKGLSNG